MMLNKYLKLICAFLVAFWILWVKFPRLSKAQRLVEIQHWAIHTLNVLGVRLDNRSQISQTIHTSRPKLLVANHVSWVDVLIIQAIQPSIFVAKAEVKKWPVIGAMASACGVIFVKRSSPAGARRMVNDVDQALNNGYCVAGFPEGTSSEGTHVHPFHANLFEAAIHHGADIQPLTLRYVTAETRQICTQTAFIADLGFLQSLHQVVSTKGIVAIAHASNALRSQGHSRKSLAQLSHQIISSQLAAIST